MLQGPVFQKIADALESLVYDLLAWGSFSISI